MLIAGLLPLLLLAAQDPPLYRSDISLLHVDAEVLDGGGRPVTGLDKADFRVFDEGHEEPVAMLAAGEQSLDLVLLVDISRSMRPKVEEIATATDAALAELHPGDRVSVLVFNTKARMISSFTADRETTRRALEAVLNLSFRGGTAIRNAVTAAADQFAQLHNRKEQSRRAVLAITDNIGIPGRSEASVVESLSKTDAILSGLIVRNRVANASPYALLGLKKLGGIEGITEKTGGDLIYSGELSTSFPEAIRRLRSRYSVYYRAPQASGRGERTVRVELSPETARRFPGAHIRARNRYRPPLAD